MPILGTCAGMIVLARAGRSTASRCSSLIDITVRRNAYGRQVDSFEADLDVDGHRPPGPRRVHPGAVDRGRRRRRPGARRARGPPGRAASRGTCSWRPSIPSCRRDRAPRVLPFLPKVGSDVRSFQVGDDQAEEGRDRRQALEACSRSSSARSRSRRGRAAATPTANTTLASAVEKAKALLRPERQHRAGDQARDRRDAEGARYEEITYEGYAPGGVALFVEALTDNRNRTAQEVRHAFTRNGGNLGEPGVDGVDVRAQGRDRGGEGGGARGRAHARAALEAGAEDMNDSESSWEIVTDPDGPRRGARRARGGGHRAVLGGAHDAAAVDDPRRTAARPRRSCS